MSPSCCQPRKACHMNKLIPSVVFWGWNSVFVLFISMLMFSGLAPTIFFATLNGNIPVSFLFSILLVIAVPIAAIVIAIRKKDRDGEFLMKLFFGVELPIFLAALIRLFVLRQMTPGAAFLLTTIAIACAYFLWSLHENKFRIRSRIGAAAHAAPSAITLAFGVGAAVFLALYAAPTAVALVKLVSELIANFFSFNWLNNFEALLAGGYFFIMLSLFLVLFIFSGLVFISAPVFMAKYYSQLWRRVETQSAPHIGGLPFLFLSLIAGGVWVGAYALSGHHREADTIAWLNDQEVLTDVREEIDARRDEIRQDLLNGYLFRYRYLQTHDSTDGVARLYRKQLKAPDAIADAAQALHRLMLAPVLYSGKGNDNVSAGRLYQEIFDASIQDAERTRISRALQATWNRDEAEAGLLDIDSKKVHISEQHIVIREFATHASVEVEEVYENRTGAQQEVYYYFSLPEDAAVTGLWLGFGEDRSKHDEFVVAPRGAAQEVYEREVQRRVDPALLEQVGPRQYRLRAFPVPPKRLPRGRDARDVQNAGELLRMRFTYDAPKTDLGVAAPRLLEKRNAYWTNKTRRTLNGVETSEAGWLPTAFPAETTDTYDDQEAIFVEGYSVTRARAAESEEPLSLALLVDTSWSMRDHGDALRSQIDALKKIPAVDAEVFLIGAGGVQSAKSPLASVGMDEALSFFGSLSPQQILSQFQAMPDKGVFDAILVLTDQGRYMADDTFESAGVTAPLWFVHLGLPAYAYDDAVLDLIYRSGGGAANNVDEAVRGVRAAANGMRLSGERAWIVEKQSSNEKVASARPPGPLAAIAARQVALSLTQNAKSAPETLDDIHALAVAHDIVTPWSSMIVLVNERQRQALKDASEKADRFSREANTGEEALTAPTVTGVPEPHEWMLLILSALMLLVVWRRRKTFSF